MSTLIMRISPKWRGHTLLLIEGEEIKQTECFIYHERKQIGETRYMYDERSEGNNNDISC